MDEVNPQPEDAVENAERRPEQPPEMVPNLAWVEEMQAFVRRNDDGSWRVGNPMRQPGADNYLAKSGFSPNQRARIFKWKAYQQPLSIEKDPYQPAEYEVDGEKYLNSYVPPDIKPADKPWPVIKSVLVFLTNGDTAGEEWLMNWMAYKMQNLNSYMRTSVVLCGAQKTGKTFLGAVLRRLVGLENSAQIGQQDIESRFNSSFATSLLVQADEVLHQDNFRDASPTLKGYTGNPRIPIEAKGISRYEVKNRMAWIFTSNDPMPVRVEGENDTRYSVFLQSLAPSPDYNQAIEAVFGGSTWGQAAHDELSGFLKALLEYPVNEAKARVPFQNADRTALIHSGRNSIESFVAEVEEAGFTQLARELEVEVGYVKGAPIKSGVYRVYSTYCQGGNQRPFSTNRFFQQLVLVRPTWTTKQVREGRNKPRVVENIPGATPFDPAVEEALGANG